MRLAQAATIYRVAIQIRSGLKEGFDIALRHRRPLEPLEVGDRMLRELQPLFASQSRVWALGSKEAISVTNDLVDRCIALLAAATERGQGGTALSRYFLGERWSEAQDEALERAHAALGVARRQLAAQLRAEAQEDAVDLMVRPERLARGNPSGRH
jgi:hypothetical protein